MMDELTKMPFTKLGLQSMPQRNHWTADTFFVEELQRSGDENLISLRGDTTAPPPLPLPQIGATIMSQWRVVAYFCDVFISACNFSVLWLILLFGWGLLCQ